MTLMTYLNRKLLTLYLSLGIVFFSAVLYLFVKNEILPDINTDLLHKVRLSSVRVIKNGFYHLRVGESRHYPGDESTMAYASNEEKRQSYFLLVNTTDKEAYVKSSSFNASLVKGPFSLGFEEDPVLPISTLDNKYRLDIVEDGKTIDSFEVPLLGSFLALDKKSDTVTAEKTLKLISTDKRVIVYLVFVID